VAPAAALLLALSLSACGGGGGGGGGAQVGTCGGGGGPSLTITGHVLYTRLRLGPSGLGPATENRPARFIDVEVRDAGTGGCYGRTSTDATGAYALLVTPPVGATLVVDVFSRTLVAGGRDLVVHEANPPSFDVHSETNAFTYASAPFPAAGGVHDLTVPYDTGPANRPSIGFGLLDILITCWDEAVGAIGSTLPRCNAYTQIGNNFTLSNSSFYNAGSDALAFLGGSAGVPDASDTDYFDDAVVAHEFSHFVDRSITYSMSRGGPHGPDLLEPNFAWSEGLATGFGCLLLRNPRYIDSTTTFGAVRLSASVENVTGMFDRDSIAGEFSVAEILWDLGDGGLGPPDTDTDGVNVSYADLYAALKSFDPSVDAPYVGLFLDRLVQMSASIDATAMGIFLAGPPEDQQIGYPLVGMAVWPTAISVGGTANSTVDATQDPWPVCRTYDASRWYHLTLAAAQVVTIDLTINPIAGSGDNLDLVLTRNSNVNVPVASSTNTGSTAESINISLQAGTYIIRVEGCGDNRADFTLTVN